MREYGAREVSVEAVIDNYSPLIFTVIKNVDHVETIAADQLGMTLLKRQM